MRLRVLRRRALLLVAVVLLSTGDGLATEPAAALGVSTVAAASLPAMAHELPALRTRDSATFLQPTGSLRTVFEFGRNYRVAGKWMPVDLTFMPTTLGWSASQNDVRVDVNGSALSIANQSGVGIVWNFDTAISVEKATSSVTHGGLTWTYENVRSGVKGSATVAARVGNRTAAFPYVLLGGTSLATSTGGELTSPAFSVPRAVILGADSRTYPAGPWMLADGVASFTWDDSSFPAEAFPYVVDPTTVFPGGTAARRAYVEAATPTPTNGTWPPPYRTYYDVPVTSPGNYDRTSGDGQNIKFHQTGSYYYYNGSTYTAFGGSNAIYRWDTSAIPDTANVTAANLTITVKRLIGSQIGVTSVAAAAEWYDPGETIGAEDLQLESSGNAGYAQQTGGVTNQSGNYSDGGVLAFTLSDAAARVSRVGHTGLRLDIAGSSPNPGPNVFLDFKEVNVQSETFTVDWNCPTACALEIAGPAFGVLDAVTILGEYAKTQAPGCSNTAGSPCRLWNFNMCGQVASCGNAGGSEVSTAVALSLRRNKSHFVALQEVCEDQFREIQMLIHASFSLGTGDTPWPMEGWHVATAISDARLPYDSYNLTCSPDAAGIRRYGIAVFTSERVTGPYAVDSSGQQVLVPEVYDLPDYGDPGDGDVTDSSYCKDTSTCPPQPWNGDETLVEQRKLVCVRFVSAGSSAEHRGCTAHSIPRSSEVWNDRQHREIAAQMNPKSAVGSPISIGIDSYRLPTAAAPEADMATYYGTDFREVDDPRQTSPVVNEPTHSQRCARCHTTVSDSLNNKYDHILISRAYWGGHTGDATSTAYSDHLPVIGTARPTWTI